MPGMAAGAAATEQLTGMDTVRIIFNFHIKKKKYRFCVWNNDF